MMRVQRSPLSVVSGAFVTLLLFSVIAFAQSKPENDFSNIRIKNFGRMDERFYRGAQPRKEDYQALAALGIKTVIDLRADPEDYERPMVEALGMRYVNIPMVDKKYPKDEDVRQFLNLANDPETGKFYVHCAGGRHRTGAMGAAYRFTKYGWNFEQVYAEMKQYDFYTRWGHGDFKKFVENYWENIQAASHAGAAASAGSH
ncbi:MAG TPA: tyrosine-protein phosphatase [Pyrinomonadaceae bacterium]|jgi:protein tyrosine/serine phosphatase